MKLYIILGSTVRLDEGFANNYIDTAWDHFRKEEGFRKAEKEARRKNITVDTKGVKVAGDENSDINDIISRVSSELREWQPNLRQYHYGVNHFFIGGTGGSNHTNLRFKWAVIFHFE